MTFPEWARHLMLDAEWRIETGCERVAALVDDEQPGAVTMRIVGPDEPEEQP